MKIVIPPRRNCTRPKKTKKNDEILLFYFDSLFVYFLEGK